MRTLFGILVLVVGLVLLGLWGRSDHAQDMEAEVLANAQAALGETIHPTQLYVAGRDITISGTANNDAERDEILARLNDVEGRRVVNDQLASLATASPYVFSGTKDDDVLSYAGNTPSEAARSAFNPSIGDAAADLEVAAGMPDAQWPTFVGSGVAALKKLNMGELNISDRTLTLSGEAMNPTVEAEIKTLLANLPQGYATDINLNVLDDGTPVALDMTYTDGDGALVTGKAPAGFDASVVADTLGQSSAYLQSSVLEGVEAVQSRFDRIGAVLPNFLSATGNIGVDTATFSGVLKERANKGAIETALRGVLGDDAEITLEETIPVVEPDPVVEEAPAVEETEEVSEAEDTTDAVETETVAVDADTQDVAGMAVPDISFLPSPDRCKITTNKFLERAQVKFVTGSATLDEESNKVMDVLATVLGRCVNQTGLSVEVGGHTDSQGDAYKNLILSKQRADAVRKALFDRGVDAGAMIAKGYGETQPIADNETAEGRAQNRRTTFIWSSNE